jgi:hypothetical protein
MEEAFSPQKRKRTSSTSKREISQLFFLLWVILALPDPVSKSGSTGLITKEEVRKS